MTQTPADPAETDKLGRVRRPYLRIDGAVLRRLRLQALRTQVAASKLGGVHRTHWSAIENELRSEVHPSTAFRLAKGVAPEGATNIEIGAIVSQFAKVP